jgi:hypothetical protein
MTERKAAGSPLRDESFVGDPEPRRRARKAAGPASASSRWIGNFASDSRGRYAAAAKPAKARSASRTQIIPRRRDYIFRRTPCHLRRLGDAARRALSNPTAELGRFRAPDHGVFRYIGPHNESESVLGISPVSAFFDAVLLVREHVNCVNRKLSQLNQAF